jgi:hypothetical protein
MESLYLHLRLKGKQRRNLVLIEFIKRGGELLCVIFYGWWRKLQRHLQHIQVVSARELLSVLEEWPLPSEHVSGDVRVLCTFSNQQMEFPEARS